MKTIIVLIIICIATISCKNNKKPVQVNAHVIPSPYSSDVRENKVERIDVYFE